MAWIAEIFDSTELSSLLGKGYVIVVRKIGQIQAARYLYGNKIFLSGNLSVAWNN